LGKPSYNVGADRNTHTHLGEAEDTNSEDDSTERRSQDELELSHTNTGGKLENPQHDSRKNTQPPGHELHRIHRTGEKQNTTQEESQHHTDRRAGENKWKTHPRGTKRRERANAKQTTNDKDQREKQMVQDDTRNLEGTPARHQQGKYTEDSSLLAHLSWQKHQSNDQQKKRRHAGDRERNSQSRAQETQMA